jgi:hypothetical protein
MRFPEDENEGRDEFLTSEFGLNPDSEMETQKDEGQELQELQEFRSCRIHSASEPQPPKSGVGVSACGRIGETRYCRRSVPHHFWPPG